MDSILEGMLKSDQDPKVKQGVVQKICDSGRRSQTVDAIEAMLSTTSRIVVESKNQYSIDACKNIFKVWANCNRSTLRQFVDERFVAYLLTASFPNNIHTLWLLQECFTMLQTEFGHTPAFQKLCVVVKNDAMNFVRENPQYQTVAALCEFLNSFHQCIPQAQYTLPFCSSLIYSVAGFQSPNDGRASRDYVHSVNITIGKFLDHLWKHSDQTCITHCLTVIFNMMSFVDKERQISPSFSLAGIVQYLPTQLMETIVSRTTENASISDANLQSAVITMVDFLSWPGTQNIDLWTIAFLKGLARAHKYSILMEIVELNIEKVFSQLEFPPLRRSCFAVLEHMLLSFQHSPEAFHKVVGKVPELVGIIRQEKREDNFLTSLSELMYTLMHQYPGFPDLYEPVVEVLQDRKRPTPEVMQRRLSQSEWGWQQPKDGTASYIASTSPSRYGRRSETGKAGLINLGNTCYMNSVLQALYMCDSFRQELLSASPSPQQPLLLSLQQVFALLTATQRAALQPTELLQASRPPWFRAGCQQDCSEYLKYVLDQLHEQEMCRLRRETEMKEARAGGGGGSGAGELPPQETPVKHRRFKFLSGKKSGAGGENPGAAEIFKSLDLGDSLIQKTFGGKVVNVYKCLKCKSESSRVESFMDLTLAFPEAAKAEKSPKWSLPGGAAVTTRSGANQKGPIMDDKPPQQPIALKDLLDYYLSPEKLEGENKYHCDKCKSKQDGERTIQIVETPDYLILTLMRFSYNVKTHSRSKIFTDVQYPKFLQLPISPEPSSPSEPSKKSKGTKSRRSVLKDAVVENYALSAVVVHSGYTSDGGHYYCYARHSIPVTPEDPSASPPWTNGKGGGGGASVQNGPDLLQDKWYMFNDNRVTYSSYESFSNVTRKFAKDTVYVLMYKKILPQDMQGLTVDPNQSVNPQAVDPPLRRDLREAVDRDNKKFLQEQELQERSRAFQRQRSSQFSPGRNFYWKDDDNNGPPGSCGGGGMGGFSARLVY